MAGMASGLSACAAALPQADPVVAPVNPDYGMERLATGAVRVFATGTARLGFADGALAKRAANALCGPEGVKSSIRDGFETGGWVFAEGCA